VFHDLAEEHYGKRMLVEISHAIERFALAAPPDEPLIVIALFQKLSYFEREAAVYREIAGRGAVTVVGLAEDFPPRLPPGVRHCLFGPADPLTREWSVTVLGPSGGATLVALDQESIDPAAQTLEEGRSFRGRWTFRRELAYREVLRLRSELTLPPGLLQEIDQVLHHVIAEPEPHRQDWWEVPLRFLTDGMGAAVREHTAARHALAAALDDTTERDPRTGLYTEQFLTRWTAGWGGTLPIGLALLHVSGLAELHGQHGLRAELAVVQGVLGCLQDRLGENDRVVRVGPEEVLLVLPKWPAAHIWRLCEQVCARIGALEGSYPFVPLTAVAAATVARTQPLPLDLLRRQAAHDAALPGSISVLAG
jgi:DICT domain-containing protein/GGDEF domain-containing protein